MGGGPTQDTQTVKNPSAAGENPGREVRKFNYSSELWYPLDQGRGRLVPVFDQRAPARAWDGLVPMFDSASSIRFTPPCLVTVRAKRNSGRSWVHCFSKTAMAHGAGTARLRALIGRGWAGRGRLVPVFHSTCCSQGRAGPRPRFIHRPPAGTRPSPPRPPLTEPLRSGFRESTPTQHLSRDYLSLPSMRWRTPGPQSSRGDSMPSRLTRQPLTVRNQKRTRNQTETKLAQ